MRLSLGLALLAALARESAAQLNTGGDVLLSVDCAGGVHLWPGSDFAIDLNLTAMMNIANSIGDHMADEARCACPRAEESEIRERFYPNLRSFLASFSFVFDPETEAYLQEAAKEPLACSGGEPGEPVFAPLRRNNFDPRTYSAVGYVLPDTCTLDSVRNGNGCKFSYTGRENSNWLVDPNSKLNVIVDECPDSSMWPFISITCEGDGCATRFFPECNPDTDDNCFTAINGDIASLLGTYVYGNGVSSNEYTVSECVSESNESFLIKEEIAKFLGISPEWNSFLYTSVSSRLDSILSVIFETLTAVVQEGEVLAIIQNTLFLITYMLILPDDAFSAEPIEGVVPAESINMAQMDALFDFDLCITLGCHPRDIGNFMCNPACNIPECAMDGNDCASCECVTGSDSSQCNFTSEEPMFSANYNYGMFILESRQTLPGMYQSFSPTETVCAVNPEAQADIKVFEDPGGCTPSETLHGWFCTVDAPTTLNDILNDPSRVLLLEGSVANDDTGVARGLQDASSDFYCGDASGPRARTCFCARPMQCGENGLWPNFRYPFSFASAIVDDAVCTHAPKPVELCELERYEVYESKLDTYETNGYDTSGAGFDTPRAEAEPGSVLHTTCDGDVVLRLLNDDLAIAASMPGLHNILRAVEAAMIPLETCIINLANLFGETGSDFTMSGVDLRLGRTPWRPEFLLGLFSSDQSLVDAGRLLFSEDWGSTARNHTGWFEFPNHDGMQLKSFLENKSVKFKMDTLAELFSTESFKLSGELAMCEDTFEPGSFDGFGKTNPLGRISLALSNPEFETTLNSATTCSDVEANDCGPGLQCTDLTDLVRNIFESADVFAVQARSFLFPEGRAPGDQCSPAHELHQNIARHLIWDFVLGGGPGAWLVDRDQAGGDPDKLLLTCAPAFVENATNIFQEAEVACEGTRDSNCFGSTVDLALDSCLAYPAMCSFPNAGVRLPGVEGSDGVCSTPLSQKFRCEQAVCMIQSQVNLATNRILFGRLSNGVFTQSIQDQEGLVSAMDACRKSCNIDTFAREFESMVQDVNTTVWPDLGANSFYCMRLSACTDTSASSHLCETQPEFVSAGIALDSEFPEENACGVSLPYSFGGTECCADNPEYLNADERAALPTGYCAERDVASAPCINCVDALQKTTENGDGLSCAEEPFTDCSYYYTKWIRVELESEYPSEKGCLDSCIETPTAECTCTPSERLDGYETFECHDPSCQVLQEPGPAYEWSEKQMVESSTQNDTVVWLTLVPEPEDVPGEIVVEQPPAILAALFSEDGRSIRVVFDAPTNKWLDDDLAVTSAPCSRILLIPGNERANNLCSWFSTTILEVRLASDAAVSATGVDQIVLVENNQIRSASNTSLPASGSSPIIWSSGAVPVPEISVSVPDVVTLCNNRVEILALEVSKVGNAPLSWEIEIFSALGLSEYVSERSVDPRFQVALDDLGGTLLNLVGEHRIVLRGYSTLNPEEPGEASATFSVTADIRPTLAIQRKGTGAIRRGLDALELRTKTEFLCDWRGELGLSAVAEFTYKWEVASNAEIPTFEPIGAEGPDSFLRVAPSSFKQAGTHLFKVTLTIDIGTPIVVTSELNVVVTNAPLILLVKGALRRAVYTSEAVILDGSLSCDPNSVSNCDPDLGYVGPQPPASALLPNVNVTWACVRRGLNATATQPCNLTLTTAIVQKIEPGKLAADFTYEFTLSAQRFQSRSVVVRARLPPPDSDNCDVVPTVAIRPVPPTVSVSRSGIILRADVSGFVSGEDGVRLEWTEVVRTDGGSIGDDENPFEDSFTLVSAAQYSPVTNREALVIKANSLSPGQTYRFRLTAVQPCTAPDHPYGEVTFRVNVAPETGTILTSKTSGVAVTDKFDFFALRFIDPDGDQPLQYAWEYTYVKPEAGKAIAPGSTFPLSPFSDSPQLVTSLELPPNGTVYVIPVARDEFGAESPRTAFVAVRVTAPDVDADDGLAVLEIFEDALAEGLQTDELLGTALAVASVVRKFSPDGENEPRAAEKALLKFVLSLGEKLTGRADPTLLSLQVNIFLSLTSNREIAPRMQRESIKRLTGIVQESRKVLDAVKRSDDDPAVLDIIPPHLSGGTLEALSGLIASAERSARARGAQYYGDDSYDGDARRRLQAAADSCTLVQQARAAIEDLARLSLEGYTDGAAARSFASTRVQFTAARESPNALGRQELGGVSDLALPAPQNQFVKGSATAPSTLSKGAFKLPPNILANATNDESPASISLIAVSFNFNVRCESVENALLSLDSIEPQCDSLESLVKLAVPATEILDVVSIDFFDASDASVSFDPQGLAEGNEIEITIPNNQLITRNGSSLCNYKNVTTATCGFYDEVLDRWSTSGCRLASVTSDFVVCKCNHASDYSAWQAFTEDLKTTFGDPITAITSVALLVLGILFPGLVTLFLISTFWAQRRDKTESDTIQKGAIGMLYMRRLEMRAKQKRFFNNLRAIRDENVDMKKLLKDQGPLDYKPAVRRRRNLCVNFIMAMRYEHSLISLFSRYDPIYARTQRVSVFCAVLLGNLLAAAFFFELKNADDITVPFIILTVFLSTIMVSIPVRLFVKTVFRTSAATGGSTGDRVQNIYRIASRTVDGIPTDGVDIDLVIAYKNFYVAKAKHEVLKKQVAALPRRRRNTLKRALKKGSGSVELLTPAQVVEVEADVKVTPIKGADKAGAKTETGAEGGASDEVEPVEVVAAPVPRAADDAADDADEENGDDDDNVQDKIERMEAGELTLETEYEQAVRHMARAKSELLKSTLAAQAEWGKAPTEATLKRIENVKRQKSLLLKVTALLADEPSSTPKVRRPMFAAGCRNLAYFVLLLFFAFSSWYVARFVLTRHRRAADIDEENEIIAAWLFAAALGVCAGYLIAEPLVMFGRFFVMPLILRMCGRRPDVAKDGKSALHVYRAEQKLAGEEQGAASSKAMLFWELSADFIESGF